MTNSSAVLSANDTPRVWVGCLACYNAGDLFGLWVDAEDAPESVDDFNDQAQRGAGILPSGHVAEAHEELWCFDSEGFFGLLGECSPCEARRVAEMLGDVDDVAAFAAFASSEGGSVDAEMVERFADAFCGLFASGADYAQELAEDIGAISRDAQWPLYCIDWERAWRELEAGGDNWSERAPGGDVYIFRAV